MFHLLYYIVPIYIRLLPINKTELIKTLQNKFPDAVVGLSDHSETIYPCLGAIALGASIIEKHFTDTKKRKGPDISASMDKEEFKLLKLGANEIYKSKAITKIL